MKLVLVRHGESEWNSKNLFTGWTDVELSPKGVEEAKEGGRTLLKEGYDFDLCYTSFLKRAIHTLDNILTEIDRVWLPVTKAWQLNERHYGALQGLNKTETAQKYGEDQVKIWRRSFDITPPPLEKSDPRSASKLVMFREIDPYFLPQTESLKETIERAVPYFLSEIKPKILRGQRVLIVAHGNSIRALVKYFENLSDEAIMEVNIPTGVPLVYTFDEGFNITDKKYLGDQSVIEAKMKSVANQGSAK